MPIVTEMYNGTYYYCRSDTQILKDALPSVSLGSTFDIHISVRVDNGAAPAVAEEQAWRYLHYSSQGLKTSKIFISSRKNERAQVSEPPSMLTPIDRNLLRSIL